jgi:hypothetical protein
MRLVLVVAVLAVAALEAGGEEVAALLEISPPNRSRLYVNQ